MVRIVQGNDCEFQIGVHSGDCASGVVGSSRVFLRLVGDTMNTASRMATTCPDRLIHVSPMTAEELQGQAGAPMCLPHKEVHLKGKGHWHTYVIPQMTKRPQARTYRSIGADGTEWERVPRPRPLKVRVGGTTLAEADVTPTNTNKLVHAAVF